MSGKLVVMAGLAMAFGTTSYFAGNSWLESQTQARLNAMEAGREAPAPQVELATVLVAAERLEFGKTLTQDMIKPVKWPRDAMPDGVFASQADLLADGNRRVIKTMEAGEPVLMAKVTGKNGKAGLAGIIAEGMRAVTIPVDMVNGVGGFVMPGDRVDIVLTRRLEEGEREGEQIAKIMMENVKVLSIDQQAETRSSEAHVAKSVTLETDTDGAQKLALANSVGRLSLLLRGAGDAENVAGASLSTSELDGRKKKKNDGFLSLFSEGKKTVTTVKVTKLDKTEEVQVPIDGASAQQQATD